MWRLASRVLCDLRMPIRLKGDFYRIVIRPAITYGARCWPIKKQHMHKMDVAGVRMLRLMYGKTWKDKIRNEHFREHLRIVSIRDKIRETSQRWFGHVHHRPTTTPVRKSQAMKVDGPARVRGRPKKTWMEVVKLDLKMCNLSHDLAHD